MTRHWPSQLFPVIVLGLLAGLSFLLMRAIEFPETRSDGKFRHDPDAIAENFTVLRYDQDGQLRYRLEAPSMRHFADDDSSLIDSPRLTHYRPDTSNIVVTSRNAAVSSKGSVAFLWDDVEVRRAATPKRPEMIATMPDLTVNTDDSTGFTDSPVEIRQGDSWLKGVGMSLDNKASTFALHSQVTGLYYRPNTPR